MDLNKFAEERNLLTMVQFEKLPTPRKLAYFKKHRKLEHFGKCPCCSERYPIDDIQADFFDTCDKYVSQMRLVLGNCEHVERK